VPSNTSALRSCQAPSKFITWQLQVRKFESSKVRKCGSSRILLVLPRILFSAVDVGFPCVHASERRVSKLSFGFGKSCECRKTLLGFWIVGLEKAACPSKCCGFPCCHAVGFDLNMMPIILLFSLNAITETTFGLRILRCLPHLLSQARCYSKPSSSVLIHTNEVKQGRTHQLLFKSQSQNMPRVCCATK
jgi:hypothetical protein